MSYTKKEFINQAFVEIGLDYTFDMQPEEYQDALKRLDGMMGTWFKKGIDLGYPIPTTPSESNLNDASNVSEYYVEAVWTNLAIRIAPFFGKTLNMETKTTARSAYKEVLQDFVIVESKPYNNLPSGAGNKPRYYNRFINANSEGE